MSSRGPTPAAVGIGADTLGESLEKRVGQGARRERRIAPRKRNLTFAALQNIPHLKSLKVSCVRKWIDKVGPRVSVHHPMGGNTSDKTTLKGFLQKIEDQYGKAGRLWIMDRGIPTEETLAQMRASDPPVHYLVGTPKGRPSKSEADLLAQAGSKLVQAWMLNCCLAKENSTYWPVPRIASPKSGPCAVANPARQDSKAAARPNGPELAASIATPHPIQRAGISLPTRRAFVVKTFEGPCRKDGPWAAAYPARAF